LLGSVLLAGGLWVLSGLCVAFDAYMVATKKDLPVGFDTVLSNYVEPFLTPGIPLTNLMCVFVGGAFQLC
jgi:hypothetical protein